MQVVMWTWQKGWKACILFYPNHLKDIVGSSLAFGTVSPRQDYFLHTAHWPLFMLWFCLPVLKPCLRRLLKSSLALTTSLTSCNMPARRLSEVGFEISGKENLSERFMKYCAGHFFLGHSQLSCCSSEIWKRLLAKDYHWTIGPQTYTLASRI